MKLESNFKNMVLVLTLISLIAAGILGAVYTVTEEPIAIAKMAKQQEAIKQVLNDFDRLEDETVDGLTVHKAYRGNAFVGAAVESETNGFGGKVKIMVGFDKEGNIIDYAILQQTETPGLGTKMDEWFKTDKNNQNIKGKHPQKNNLTVDKDGGEVDAITAATISSRAFLTAVNLAYNAFAANSGAPTVDVVSGATQHEADNSPATAAKDTVKVAKKPKSDAPRTTATTPASAAKDSVKAVSGAAPRRAAATPAPAAEDNTPQEASSAPGDSPQPTTDSPAPAANTAPAPDNTPQEAATDNSTNALNE